MKRVRTGRGTCIWRKEAEQIRLYLVGGSLSSSIEIYSGKANEKNEKHPFVLYEE